MLQQVSPSLYPLTNLIADKIGRCSVLCVVFFSFSFFPWKPVVFVTVKSELVLGQGLKAVRPECQLDYQAGSIFQKGRQSFFKLVLIVNITQYNTVLYSGVLWFIPTAVTFFLLSTMSAW